MSDAITPRGADAYQCAVKLLEALCGLPRPARTVGEAIKRVEQVYRERGKECPASEITMRKWAERGLDIPGVPEAGKPLMEVADDVDEGSEVLRRLGGGDAVSAMLRARVLDDAVKLAGDTVKSDEFKAHVKIRPADLTSLIGKLTAAEKGGHGSVDVMEMIEELDEEQATAVVYRLLERYTSIIVALQAGFEGEKQAN